MTKLEKVALFHTDYPKTNNGGEVQKFLDRHCSEILDMLTPYDLCDSTRGVYDETTGEYEAEPHNRDIIDELIMFMNMLDPYARVLDLGCGYGRDTFFMSIGEEDFRRSLMGRVKNGASTFEKFLVPKKLFRVTGVDGSAEMIKLAEHKKEDFIKTGHLFMEQLYPQFLCEDMHALFLSGKFDAIWSCTSLFTHTPYAFLEDGMAGVADHLKLGGIFFTSYTNGLATGRYNVFRLSSTGHIKYFSQPTPQEIQTLARRHGLELFREEINDYEKDGQVIKKDLFVSQFFRKI